MRGRLICPMLAEIARLDTQATEQAGGYDPDFRTVRTSYPGGVRTSARRELPPVQVPCQVEDGSWESQRQTAAGNAPDSRLVLVFHYEDLEQLGLVDPTTLDALLRVNDRLVRLLDRDTGALALRVRDEAGGLFITEAKPGGLGLGGRRNLLIATFEERPQGLTA